MVLTRSRVLKKASIFTEWTCSSSPRGRRAFITNLSVNPSPLVSVGNVWICEKAIRGQSDSVFLRIQFHVSFIGSTDVGVPHKTPKNRLPPYAYPTQIYCRCHGAAIHESLINYHPVRPTSAATNRALRSAATREMDRPVVF